MATTLQVPDISCDHCKSSIESAVGALTGVDRVEVDVAARSVVVEHPTASLDDVIDVIEEQGYEVAR